MKQKFWSSRKPLSENEQEHIDNLTKIAHKCGLEASKDKAGFFKVAGTSTEIDLTACASNEKAILKTAMIQLAERIEDIRNNN